MQKKNPAFKRDQIKFVQKTTTLKFNKATIKELSIYAKMKSVYFELDKHLNVIANEEHLQFFKLSIESYYKQIVNFHPKHIFSINADVYWMKQFQLSDR